MSLADDLRDAWVSVRADIIDLYETKTALFEINLTEAEQYETAHYDAFASATNSDNRGRNDNRPKGKRVY